jgi:hypothetical protein
VSIVLRWVKHYAGAENMTGPTMAVVGGEYPISWFYVNLSRVRLAEIDIVRLLCQTPISRRKKTSHDCFY